MKLNKNFQVACQARLDEKSKEYDGKDNPKNYRNMDLWQLAVLIYLDAYSLEENAGEIVNGATDKEYKEVVQELCCDIPNRCQMLWERLGER